MFNKMVGWHLHAREVATAHLNSTTSLAVADSSSAAGPPEVLEQFKLRRGAGM
jgi:hypothetical protein